MASITNKTKTGFTMIEFSLATTFIAVLLITIAIITNNIITIYQKGLTLKAVNSVGRGLIDELVTGINAAPSVDTVSLCNSHVSDLDNGAYIRTCEQDHASNFVFQHKLGTRTFAGGEGTSEVQMAGIFCTGNYSYIWNTYYGLEPTGTSLSLEYTTLNAAGTAETKTLTDFRLVRVKDPTYRVCSSSTTDKYRTRFSEEPYYTTIDITKLANGSDNYIPEPEQGFLSSFDLDLQLYEFTIFPISQDSVTLRTFMSGTFILATERGNINLSRSGDYCDVKDLDDTIENASAITELGSEFNYCAINKFNFAARTAGN